MKCEIKELDRQQYDYYELHYTYKSDSIYKASVIDSTSVLSFTYKLENLGTPYEHDSYDTLFQEYWQDPTAFGVFIDDCNEPVAFLEVAREYWNSRLVITQLLVREDLRGKGIGKMLVDKAKDVARFEDFRMITLETQSCNVPAISFYKKNGFVFSGTNIFFYSNDDISEDEVMLEMAFLLD